MKALVTIETIDKDIIKMIMSSTRPNARWSLKSTNTTRKKLQLIQNRVKMSN